MKQAREIVRLSMECQSSPEDYCDVACRCDPLSVTRPLIARALDAAREEGARDAGWVEITYKQGRRAGIEEALSRVKVRFGRDYHKKIGCWKEWHEAHDGESYEQFADFIPYAEIRALLSPEPRGEK